MIQDKIGIIGGYGSIGQYAYDTIVKYYPNIKIGGRNPEQLTAVQKARFPNAVFEKVDVHQPDSLRKFAKDCRLIVNCAGPSNFISYDVCKIISEMGIPCADAGFDMRFLQMNQETASIALYGCGSAPGLSGLFQKYLLNQFEKAKEMTYYYGGLSEFSRTAAEDYLIGACGEKTASMGEWKNGQKQQVSTFSQEKVTLPYFPQEVMPIPYFDEECEAVAQTSNITHAKWFMVTDGERVSELMKNARYEWKKNPQNLITSLCSSAKLDMIGRNSYLCFLILASGIKDNQPLHKQLVYKISNPSMLTGTGAGIAALAILEGKTPDTGFHAFSEAVSPEYAVQHLQNLNIADIFEINSVGTDALTETEEGEI